MNIFYFIGEFLFKINFPGNSFTIFFIAFLPGYCLFVLQKQAKETPEKLLVAFRIFARRFAFFAVALRRYRYYYSRPPNGHHQPSH